MINSIFIAADPPMPPTGGGVRTLNFALTLAEKTRCKLFILFPVSKTKLPSQLVENCSEIIVSNINFSTSVNNRLKTFLNNLRWIFAPWSFKKNQLISLADYLASNPYSGGNVFASLFYLIMRFSVVYYALILYKLGYTMPSRSLERVKQFDGLKKDIYNQMKSSEIIWIDFSTLFPFFINLKNNFPSSKIICNAHNIEYRVLERMEVLAKDKLEKIWYKNQASIMKKAELTGFSQCDLIFTCSEQDKNEILTNLPNSNVHVYPNGVDTDYFIPHSKPTQYPSLLFAGTMGYKPTRDAVEYFIEKIFPHVTKLNPTCKFIIAGANAAKVFQKYEGRSDIEIISSPPDMRPSYDKSWVVVVPLRVGGGTRLKILEAMAMEKPVVSTSIGVEGIDVNDKEHLFVLDNEKEFADGINFLIHNEDQRNKMSANAKKRVVDVYGWNIIRANLANMIESLS